MPAVRCGDAVGVRECPADHPGACRHAAVRADRAAARRVDTPTAAMPLVRAKGIASAMASIATTLPSPW